MSQQRPTLSNRHNKSIDPDVNLPQFQIQLAAFDDPSFKLYKLMDGITYHPLSLQQTDNTDSPDLRPFAKLFQVTIDDLTKLRKRVQREMDDLEDQLNAQERTSMTKLSELDNLFTTVTNCFDTLESRVSEVGTTAIRIGEQLETIDKQRSKASEFRELLVFLLDLNIGSLKPLEDLIKTEQGQVRAAIIARRMQHVLKDIDSSTTRTARLAIDKFCEQFESEQLHDFEIAANVNNISRLKHLFTVLFEFNGGESAVRVFINRHPIFTVVHPAAGTSPNLPGPPKVVHDEAGLRQLFEQLRATIYQDWDTISQVFKHPIAVLTQLIQRYFHQVVQTHLDDMLQEASKASNPHYLNTLSKVDKITKSLIKDVGHFDATILQRPGVIARVIEQAVEEQFARFRSSIDREIAHLETIIETQFKEAHTYYLARQQQNKSMFSRIQKMAGPATLEHHLSVKDVMAILQAHTEALERNTQLHSDPIPVIVKLNSVLCEQVYIKYTEIALSVTYDECVSMDGSKVEPDLKVLSTVQMANSIVQLMQVHFETRTLPMLTCMPTVHRTVIDVKNKMVTKLESLSSAICEHLLTSTIAYIQLLLSRQKKTDFRAKAEDDIDILDQLNSPTCISVCEFLTKVCAQIQTFLDGENLKAFALDLGIHFHAQLLDHFKKFPVSTSGALSLTRDISKYQEKISTLNVPELVSRFEMLREFGHMFLVRPENLPSILSEGILAQLDSSTLQAYLVNRSDYKTAHIEDMIQDRGNGVNVSGKDDGNLQHGASIQMLNSGYQGSFK